MGRARARVVGVAPIRVAIDALVEEAPQHTLRGAGAAPLARGRDLVIGGELGDELAQVRVRVEGRPSLHEPSWQRGRRRQTMKRIGAGRPVEVAGELLLQKTAEGVRSGKRARRGPQRQQGGLAL